MKNFVKTMIVGVGATLAMDLWTFILRLFDVTSHGLQYVGRWVAYFPSGKFIHHSIIQTPGMPYEKLIGFIAHYCIGIGFAFLLSAAFGKKWLSRPRIFPALFIGLTTLLVPTLIIQPALGFGVAFSNMPNQGLLLLKSFSIHIIYGLGLYLSAKLNREVRYSYLLMSR